MVAANDRPSAAKAFKSERTRLPQQRSALPLDTPRSTSLHRVWGGGGEGGGHDLFCRDPGTGTVACGHGVLMQAFCGQALRKGMGGPIVGTGSATGDGACFLLSSPAKTA